MKKLKKNLVVVAAVAAVAIFGIVFKQKVWKKTTTLATKPTVINAVSKLLSEKSPYFDINKDRVNGKIDSLIRALETTEKVNDPDELLSNVQHIFSELGDRHASVKKLEPEQETGRYYLPFALAPWQENGVIALQQLPKLKYSFYLERYPFLSEIQDENIIKFIYRQDVLNKHAPSQSRLSLGVEKMNEFHQINNDLKIGDTIKLKFSNKARTKDTIVYVNLVNYKTKWREFSKHFLRPEKTKKSYQNLHMRYDDGIEYIRIPEMFDKSDNELFFQWLAEYMNSVRDSEALIIDIRNNSGGKRDLINFFSNYFIKPNESVITNFAKYKAKLTTVTKENLANRSLYPLDHFSENIQNLILQKTPKKIKDNAIFNDQNYSDYHYMVLKNNALFEDYYFYNKPVYIMINEYTFSAASILASSFKGLDKITLVGVKSDGSSGLSQFYEISGLRLKFSHMLSYQKNGDLFDGVGTEPDIEIKRSMDHIFGLEDYQLNTLIEKINN